MNELMVLVKKDEAVTTSLIISEKINYPHYRVTTLIERHIEDFKDYGAISFETSLHNSKKVKVYHLNRGQFMLLVTYLRATKKASAINNLKKDMVKAFDVLIDFLKHKQSEEYKRTRLDSKENQKHQMSLIGKHLPKVSYIKPSTIANKAVSMAYGLPYMIKKEDMTAEQLALHTIFLNKAVALITVQELGVEIESVSKLVYADIPKVIQATFPHLEAVKEIE